MPVPGGPFKPEVVFGCEVASHGPDHHDQEHDRTNGNVESVEARQHIKRGTVDARSQCQVQVLVAVHVLDNLQANEDETEQHCQEQAEDEGAAVAFQNSMVRPRAGDAAGQQDQGVDRR